MAVTKAKLELVRRDISQRTVADVAGVREEAISRVLLGKRRPQPAVIAALVAATGLEENELFEPAS